VYNLNRLRLLREVHFRGTLAAAAEALGHNPSTVSHQLATLEREVGVRLLEPIGRGVRLTDEALILVEHTGQALRHLEEAQAGIAAAGGRVQGLVRVATFQTAAHAVLPEVATGLLAAHPALRLRVTHVPVQEALPGLVARDFDLVLQEEFPGHPEPRVPGVERTPLAPDPLWLVSALAAPVATLAEAAGRPWAMEPLGTLARRWSTAACRTAGFEPDVVYETSDVLLHLRLARAGAAVALVPGLALRAVRPEGEPERVVSLAVREGAGRSPALAAVKDALGVAFAGPLISPG
jgi:DNA-binding transcriptional LysR family regulator